MNAKVIEEVVEWWPERYRTRFWQDVANVLMRVDTPDAVYDQVVANVYDYWCLDDDMFVEVYSKHGGVLFGRVAQR